MNRSEFKKKLAEEVHAGLRGFINYILGKADHLPDGSITFKKAQADRWKRISNSTHYKLRTNEKVWANTIVENIMKNMAAVKKKISKVKADPRVTSIKNEFVEYCKDLRDFEPIIDHGKDGLIIKKLLEKYTEAEILDCLDWFLREKDFENFSPTISTALSIAIFNKFLSKQ